MLVKVPLYLILSNLLFPFFFAFLDFLYSNFCCWRFLNCLTTMEALSSSTILSKLPKTNHLVPETPQFSIRPCNKRVGYLKIDESFNLSLGISNSERVRISGSKILAVSKDVSGETEENPGSENGRGLVSDESHTLAEANPDLKPNMKKVFDDTSKPAAPITAGFVSGTGGGTRAGLFRTPISGGVQSATSAHDLPRPALAVRNLMEQARFAHLCTVMSRMHHRRQGYPFGSLVDFAPDSLGHPIFSFSPLAIHTRNLLADPRCTLVVQIPGWSGLSNARVTIFGDVFPLPEDQQEWAHKQYIRKHQQGPSQQWGNFHYFRMQNISDIYFIGGFGTVAWVDVNEYENLKPDKIAVEGGEQYLKELNAIFSKPLRELLSTEVEVDDAALISIDSKGTDVRVRQGAQFNIQRISFEEGHAVETLEQAKAALQKLISKGRVYNLQK